MESTHPMPSIALLLGNLAISMSAAAVSVPPGFAVQQVTNGLSNPTAMAFAPDGRIFIAEQRGTVRVIIDGVLQPAFFIDLRSEVAGAGYRGMLGIALDPSFLQNHRVYLSYVVDPNPGEPDEPDDVPTFSRLVRYSGTTASNGNIADVSTRTILIGAQPNQGIPVCWAHTIDALHFGPDGKLFVASGEGSHYEFADDGGNDPQCFQPPLFGPDQDLGAFRAQYLNSMAGKILRIDPETGAGLASNPYWNGDANSNRSKVWVYGLRNPFRFCVRPTVNTQTPGTLFIGDVGWDTVEEVNVSQSGGENFGWPCYEGPGPAPDYPSLNPSGSGCNTIGTPSNPGPLTPPLASWTHTNPNQSFPPGSIGSNAVGGVFYTGASYPQAYRGAYFYGDYGAGWINVLKVNGNNQYVNSFAFASGINWLVDIEPDPVSGDLFYVTVFDGKLWQISYDGPGVGDVNGDFSVNAADLLFIINNWGPCPGGPAQCPADIDGNGVVNVADLLFVINNWG